MNFAERLAGLYLRLNGFFLMPEFSTFTVGSEERDRKAHAHVDILAFRPTRSFEEFEGTCLPLDAALFRAFQSVIENPFEQNIAAVCEVRSNETGQFPKRKRQEYAAQMCGGVRVIAMCCDASLDGVKYDSKAKGIRFGLAHALRWIGARITWLNNKKIPKSQSWTWSEPMLADILVLDRLHPICSRTDEMMFAFPRKNRKRSRLEPPEFFGLHQRP
jgi:hypothetical protein